MRGVTAGPGGRTWGRRISTHTPHARRDPLHNRHCFNIYNFNSHASCEAWRGIIPRDTPVENISTHTPHARRDIFPQNLLNLIYISTHTPHARRDGRTWGQDLGQAYFNSHASCEAWPPNDRCSDSMYYFNSHASCEAWRGSFDNIWMLLYFNSHASCEAWPAHTNPMLLQISDFNSHASCEAWLCTYILLIEFLLFQLTRLMRGVTSEGGVPPFGGKLFQLTRLMRGVTI